MKKMTKPNLIVKDPVTGVTSYYLQGELVNKETFLATALAQTLFGFAVSYVLGKATGLGFWKGVGVVWAARALQNFDNIKVGIE